MVSNRYLRLPVVLAMWVTLFLPVHPDIGLVLAEIVFTVQSALRMPTLFLLALLALWYPIILLCNTWMAFSPSNRLQAIYRVLLFTYLPWAWTNAVGMSDQGSGLQIGHWAVPVVVSVAALVEVFLIVRGRLEKRKNPGQ